MSENVGSIYYEVDAKTDGLLKAQQDAGNITKKIANSLGLVETSTKGMSAEFKKVKAATDPAFASLVKMEKEISVITTEFNEGRISGDQYRKTIDALTGKLGVTAKSTTPLQKGLDTTTVKTNKMSNSIRQASMQLSQVAQQGSVTGNYMQALAIQLPDLALGFGTVGIVAGALAGTLGVALLDSMSNSSGAATDLSEDIANLREEFRKTNKEVLGTFDKFELGKETIALEKAIEDLTSRERSIREAAKELIVDTTGIEDGFFSRASSGEALLAAKARIKENGEILRLAETKEAEKASKQVQDIEGDRLASLFESRRKAALSIVEQTAKQFQDEQTLADEQLEMRLTAIDDAQISVAEKEQAEYEARALHAQKLAELDAKRTTNEQAEAAKRLTLKKMELAAYTQLGGQLTNLVAAAGAENTAIGKAVFLANQALAVAGIIVNTQAAAGAALAQGGPIAGPALAANVTALGYTSAAIAGGVAVGQTFSGRQTGGPTEANSTYRVNEAGGEGFQFKSGGREFIQTLGGNGKVIPANEMNQGGSAPQISINVINQNGSNVNVSQEQDGNNVTIQMLVADFAEGGPVSRSMSSSFNTKRKTT